VKSIPLTESVIGILFTICDWQIVDKSKNNKIIFFIKTNIEKIYLITNVFLGRAGIKNRLNSFSISIVSNFQFVSDIKDKLGYGKIYQSENIHILLFNKISEIKNFCEYIYKDSTIFLERKKQIFDKIK
jgi:hypothetical protein